MPLLLLGTAMSGVAAAGGYRGSLKVVNQIAPDDRRAELVSSYLMMGFLGNSLPVIGVGILTKLFSPLFANISLIAVIAALAVVALVTGISLRPARR